MSKPRLEEFTGRPAVNYCLLCYLICLMVSSIFYQQCSLITQKLLPPFTMRETLSFNLAIVLFFLVIFNEIMYHVYVPFKFDTNQEIIPYASHPSRYLKMYIYRAFTVIIDGFWVVECNFYYVIWSIPSWFFNLWRINHQRVISLLYMVHIIKNTIVCPLHQVPLNGK